jgi:hypothetical protein
VLLLLPRVEQRAERRDTVCFFGNGRELLGEVHVNHQGLQGSMPCDALEIVERSTVDKVHGAEIVSDRV